MSLRGLLLLILHLYAFGELDDRELGELLRRHVHPVGRKMEMHHAVDVRQYASDEVVPAGTGILRPGDLHHTIGISGEREVDLLSLLRCFLPVPRSFGERHCHGKIISFIEIPLEIDRRRDLILCPIDHRTAIFAADPDKAR